MNRDPTFEYTTGGSDAEVGVTCCTNWNTSTGDTGYASFEDSCPADQFQLIEERMAVGNFFSLFSPLA